jgi:undecaprenyl-diphosphatase
MTFLQILTLAIVQGFTEFLPVSSSGHLILVPHLTGWADQGLHFDIAVHLGTLLAVMLYFRSDIAMILRDSLASLRTRRMSFGARLAVFIVIGTIPAVAFGVAYKHFFPDGIRSVTFVACNLIVFGALMWVADRYSSSRNNLQRLGWRSAIVIGLMQMLAIIPGVSRSGITITAARFLSINRSDAARYSMLLAIPAIAGAAVLGFAEMIASPQPVIWGDVGQGIALSFIAGLVAITFMMQWLRSMNLNIFVGYRILLGVGLLIYFS